MARVVCQVNARPDRVSFIWSEGAASFEPYHLAGPGFQNFRALAHQARELLDELARTQAHGSEGEVRQAGHALAEVGSQLYRQMFLAAAESRPAAATPAAEHAARAAEGREWLGGLQSQDALESLEVVTDADAPVPWNVVYDQDPGGFHGSPDPWRAFWGVRLNLAVTRRVDPLRQTPVLDQPEVLLAVDPGL